ncbi:hypothetical protein JTB14_006392 [Gonioctena quinquepunctata]|nr:hypothetical protein JTB14_006392 [Gonioctena quinquepunctata]
MKDIVRESIYNQNIERLTEENKEELNRLKSKTENNKKFLKSPVKKKETESYPALASKNNEQKFPRKTVNIQPPQKDIKVIEISNRYELLPNEEMEIPTEEHTEEISKAMNKPKGKAQTPVVSNKQKIPPIVIKGKLTAESTMASLRTAIKGRKFTIEHKRHNTMIYPKSNEDRIIIMQLLQKINYEFHTYTWKEEKTHAFILKGLDQEPTIDEIKVALLDEYKLEAKKVYRFGTYNAIYMVVTPKNYTLKHMQTHERKAHPKQKSAKPRYVDAPPPANIAWKGENKIREQTRPTQGRSEAREEANFERRGPREIHATPGSPFLPMQDGSTGPRGSSGESSGSDFKALASRITKLNSLINFSEMIREYDILIERIENAESTSERKMALHKFFGVNGDLF